ncbi:oxidoreductase [Citrobacter freundii]|nr:oxidoreductase [Citrobacter freundii]
MALRSITGGRIAASVESAYRYQPATRKSSPVGDAVRGADLVVTAMAEGRHAAQGIVDWLGIKSAKSH